jgi:predicted DNA-binding transcriptional regulator AlpA
MRNTGHPAHKDSASRDGAVQIAQALRTLSVELSRLAAIIENACNEQSAGQSRTRIRAGHAPVGQSQALPWNNRVGGEPGDVMFNVNEVCAFFGGANSPVDRSTLYRGIRAGHFPRAIKVGPKMSRWRRSDCQAALDRMR